MLIQDLSEDKVLTIFCSCRACLQEIVSEMGIHLRQTILDCIGVLKSSAEEARFSDRCASSRESVDIMLEQNDVKR